MNLSAWLNVWEANGCVFATDPADEPRIDAAVSKWLDSGKTRDTLLSLSFLDGREYKVLASNIVSWAISTSESREKEYEIRKFQEDEDKELKSRVGLWED